MPAIVIRSISGLIYVATIIIPLLLLQNIFPVIILFYGVIILLEFRMLARKACRSYKLFYCSRWNYFMVAVFWIIIPMGLLAFMPFILDRVVGCCGSFHTLMAFIMVWTHDSFAYLTGILFGKNPLAPKISPKKTIEGAVGGAFFTLLLAVGLMVCYDSGMSGIFWIGSALLVVVFSNLGDLAQSKLKRAAGVKDSGNIMPGHGGFFDRFDAMLFVAPLWLIWLWLAG